MKRWWRQRTLRFRLAMWYALGGTLLLSAFSATVYFYVAGWMARPLDEPLRTELATIQTHVTVGLNGEVLWDRQPLTAELRLGGTEPWFEFWDQRQQLVLRHWPFESSQIERIPAAPVAGRETLSIFNVAPDLRLRVLSTPFHGPANAPWMVRVMRIHEPAADALQALLLIIVIALPIVVTLLVVVGYAMTRRWLKPLDRMVAEAQHITADDLSRRLPVENASDELGQLATVFNVTLDRLESSFVALDRFVADASHELRTPLTTLRSVGEVGLRRGRTVEEYREIIGSMLEEAQRLQQLIQRLLELASAEGGAQIIHRQPLKLDDYVVMCLAELGVLAEAKNQRIVFEPGGCNLTTDPVIFRQALQNLVDNAIKYSPSESVIRVATRSFSGGCCVSVSDEGPGIAVEQRAQITDRFFRADTARSRRAGGFGLGLAITKAYATALGGTLEFEPAEPTGSVFRLIFPSE